MAMKTITKLVKNRDFRMLRQDRLKDFKFLCAHTDLDGMVEVVFYDRTPKPL